MSRSDEVTSRVKAEDIEALVQLFDESSWDELHLQIDGLELFISSDPAARFVDSTGQLATVQRARSTVTTAALTNEPRGMGHLAPPPEPAVVVSTVPDTWIAVAAPSLGTFYRSPKPGAPPYAELGQEVDADTEICVIEVMKLFTALRAGTSGVIRRICASDSEMVEFGQPLFYIEPA
jgi:acetyl-CoA carboxylase biotin carboxyl carrier protein